jgi:transposase
LKTLAFTALLWYNISILNKGKFGVFMASNYHKSFIKDYEKLLLKVDELSGLIKDQSATIKTLNDTINNMTNQLAKKDEQISKLILEIERLKNNNDKDSSNSSKPSSKNGFKKVKNSREKTNRKQGGQKGHQGHTSKVSKVKKLIESGEAKHTVIEVNKSKNNQNRPYKIRYVQDIEISTIIKEYHYYRDSRGSYNIPKEQNNVVTYGCNVKAASMLLVHRAPSSMDQCVSYLNAITNGNFEITKSTLNNWTCTLSDKLDPLMKEIKHELYNAYYVNTDESPINVNGKDHQLHNYSNEKYTLQYIHERKSKEAITVLDFLPNYFGTLIHDHNIVQYNYGTRHSECNAHILRYLKAVEDFTDHEWSKEMSEHLKGILHQKHLLLIEGIPAFDKKTLQSYSRKYDDILKTASKEYQSDYETNAYKDDERKLITRLGEYKENHLLFMYDFKIPFTNNRSETDIRPAKRKQNVGIFRSQNGARCYLQIRSFISTFLKNNRDIFEEIKNAFDGKIISLNLGN